MNVLLLRIFKFYMISILYIRDVIWGPGQRLLRRKPIVFSFHLMGCL